MSSAASSSGAAAGKPMDPVLRNAMRYSLSPHEYELLHKYLLKRTPLVKKTAPKPASFQKAVKGTDDYNAETVRLTIRLLLTSYLGLKVWEEVVPKILARGKPLP
jgi:hypothetical protein